MVFKKMLGAFGVGGPTVDTVLAHPATRPGLSLSGQVNLVGGSHDVDIEHVTLSLVTRVEVEGGESAYDATVEFHRLPVTGAMRLAEGQHLSIPFSLSVPWETPITDVYGQHLHGMVMGVRTEVAIARAVDKGDLDAIQVHPLPAQELILDALARLGFRFSSADLEGGHIRGSQQTLPFYQEIEFYAAPQYAHACSQLEVTFITNPSVVEVILEVDKRGGLFTAGHDVYHTLRVPHVGGEQTDWAAVIDGWFQQAVRSHAPAHGYPPAQPTYGHGHHGHKHDSDHGAGAAVAGVGAGNVSPSAAPDSRRDAGRVFLSDERLRAMYATGAGNATARRFARFWGAVQGAGLLPRRWVTLEVPGRRSGKLTRFPLGMADRHGEWYLVSMLGEHCNWVRNVRAAGGLVTLQHARRRRVRLVEVPVADRPPVLKRYVQKVPGGRPHIPVDRHAPLAEFATIAARYPVFHVRPIETGEQGMAG